MTDGNCQQASEAVQYLRKTVVDCHLKISSVHTNNSTSWKPLPSKKGRQYYAVSDAASSGSVGGRVKSADCFLYLMAKKDHSLFIVVLAEKAGPSVYLGPICTQFAFYLYVLEFLSLCIIFTVFKELFF